MNICWKYNFFSGRSLFTSDRKVDTWFRPHVHWFALVVLIQFSFSSLIYIDIKRVFLKSIPVNIVSWLGKIILMPNYWPSRSRVRWMSIVRNVKYETWCYSVHSVYCWHVFCFGFLDKFNLMCLWLEKFICIHKRVKGVDCVHRVYKILRWIGSSDFKCP